MLPKLREENARDKTKGKKKSVKDVVVEGRTLNVVVVKAGTNTNR